MPTDARPTLIIAGVPQPIVTRNKRFQPSIDGWRVEMIHSRKNHADVSTCWREVLACADATAEAGAHIAAFHLSPTGREHFARTVYARHRLFWPDRTLLRDFGTPRFLAGLEARIYFEMDWRNVIRPRALPDAALLLPETAFEVETPLASVWARSQKVSPSHDSLEAVAAYIEQIRGAYYKGDRTWEDAHGLRWRVDPSAHATCPRDRRWKYTVCLPEHFHFDVHHHRRAPFSLPDHAGNRRTFREYTNVDAHGWIRGGK